MITGRENDDIRLETGSKAVGKEGRHSQQTATGSASDMVTLISTYSPRTFCYALKHVYEAKGA